MSLKMLDGQKDFFKQKSIIWKILKYNVAEVAICIKFKIFRRLNWEYTRATCDSQAVGCANLH